MPHISTSQRRYSPSSHPGFFPSLSPPSPTTGLLCHDSDDSSLQVQVSKRALPAHPAATAHTHAHTHTGSAVHTGDKLGQVHNQPAAAAPRGDRDHYSCCYKHILTSSADLVQVINRTAQAQILFYVIC